jgi:phage terminase Nu1 subunit (DNA packaging protein)
MALEVVADARVPDIRKANRAEAAEWFGVSQNTIHSWITRGCPYLVRGERGTPWVLDLLAIAQWKYGAADGANPEADPETFDPKTRLDWYKGEAERLSVAKQKGDLLPRDEVAAAWVERVQILRGRLMALPSRVAPIVASAPDMRAIEQAIRSEIIDVLTELADEAASQ